MNVSFVLGEHPTPLERRAAALGAARVQALIGQAVQVCDPSQARDGFQIFLGTPSSSQKIRDLNLTFSDLGDEGFVIVPGDRGMDLVVAAPNAIGVLYGVGEVLRCCSISPEGWTLPTQALRSAPAKSVRGIYFATHFGNWYCRAPLETLERYLEDLALWGVNRLMLWFDLHDKSSVNDDPELWARLQALEMFARQVGMQVGWIALANEGLCGQVGTGQVTLHDAPERTGTAAASGRDFSGYDTDLCPSHPQGKLLILENRRTWLKKVGQLEHLWLWPYDQGGCACASCTPWPRTFVNLAQTLCVETHQIYPSAQLSLSAWWFEQHRLGEERVLFSALETAGDAFASMIVGEAQLERWMDEGRLLPTRPPLILFPEISMFDSLPWGGRGMNPIPTVIAARFSRLEGELMGAVPYSEGCFEDLNKVVWARLCWNPQLSPEVIVAEYARMHFGCGSGEVVSLLFSLEERTLARLRRRAVSHLDAPTAKVEANREAAGAFILEKQVQDLEADMPEGLKGTWRWDLLRLSVRLEALLETLSALNSKSSAFQTSRGELESVYAQLQHGVYHHHSDHTLNTWMYRPAAEVWPEFYPRTARQKEFTP